MSHDFVIVGSGAAGASAAKYLTQRGFSVLVLEEGDWYRRPDFKSDVYTAIDKTFRGYGSQLAKGRSLVPILQGCCVGGSTVINGAICHELPEEIYNTWVESWGSDSLLPLEKIRQFEASISKDLKLGPTLFSVEDLPVARALQKLHWEFSPMTRNAPGCVGSGNCLQGCPSGAKLSMEASFLPEAIKKGAELKSKHKVLSVETGGVWAKCLSSGGVRKFEAKRGVLLAAGVVHTPYILLKSKVRHAHLGKNFQCHISFGVLGHLKEKVRSVEGQPQGIEVFPPDTKDIKLATQLLPPELLFARVPLVGKELTKALEEWEFFSSWTGSIRSNATGEIRAGWRKPKIRYTPTLEDMKKVRTALKAIVNLLFEMDAREVFPGVNGVRERISSREELSELPLDPRSYFLGAGHLFGTARFGKDVEADPVDENFEVRGMKGVHVIDASLFPSNIGVNPQLSIMALAMAASERIVERTA